MEKALTAKVTWRIIPFVMVLYTIVGAHHTGDETGLVGQHLRPGRPILRV